jgi:phosphonate transport system substrate-binding protein
MKSLALTTYLAENTEPVCHAVAGHLTSRLGLPVTYDAALSWAERARGIDSGEIALSWLCGLLYIRKVEQMSTPLVPLVAPVMAGEGYSREATYSSKLIVHRDSDYQAFEDLRGTRLAINEPGSFSGSVVVQAHLASLGESGAFFREVVISGGHAQSMRWVAGGQATAAAIDCTVYNYFLPRHPQLARSLRVITVLGPNPAPPWVIAPTIPQTVRRQIKQLLLEMAEEEQGQEMLAAGHVRRFRAVSDQDYDPIRQKARQASSVPWKFLGKIRG